jgi:hypothetical protein
LLHIRSEGVARGFRGEMVNGLMVAHWCCIENEKQPDGQHGRSGTPASTVRNVSGLIPNSLQQSSQRVPRTIDACVNEYQM